jgi:hypothetical protein
MVRKVLCHSGLKQEAALSTGRVWANLQAYARPRSRAGPDSLNTGEIHRIGENGDPGTLRRMGGFDLALATISGRPSITIWRMMPGTASHLLDAVQSMEYKATS